MPCVHFITLGCRLNQAEEGGFARDFAAHGWTTLFGSDDNIPSECDAVVLHSCAVTRQAERKTLQAVRALNRHAGNKPVIAVTGCATAALPEDVFFSAGADLIVKRSQYSELRKMIEDFLAQRTSGDAACFATALADAGNSTDSRCSPSTTIWPHPLLRRDRHHAMLKVQDGCGFHCSYCIVPSTRGTPVSRPFDDSVEEAVRLAKAGVPEIVLTGCNLACYHSDGASLPDLAFAICRAVAPFSAIVSLGSVEPAICDEKIVETMLSQHNLKHFIHLPIQSGDSHVLALAHRHYDESRIREILSLYRKSIDNLFLGGDFITGLPGEDDAAFARTCALVKDFAFNHIHVFPFSPRQGTEALHATETPSRAIARNRATQLRAIAEK